MDKRFSFMSAINGELGYPTYDLAEKAAKVHTQQYKQTCAIVQAISLTEVPVPNVTVTKL